jgi:RND family efflux transporter MFP subunit
MISPNIELRGIRLSGLVLIAGTLVACGDKPEADVEEVVRPAKLMTINSGGNGIIREYPGTVSATQSVELGFEVPGKIVELPISDGLGVKKGTLLGKLDESDFLAARELAEANRKAADSAHERAKRIFEQGAGSQAEVDKTLRDIDVAKQELTKAQKALNDTVLKAPFTGKVSRKIADNFQNVQAKQSILLLEDISSLELDVNVPEQDFSRMVPGLSLKQRNERVKPEIQVSSIANRSFKARLISFETSADPVTRTYHATFAFDNPEDVNVLPGMTAKAVLNIPVDNPGVTGVQGLLIPATAVVTNIDGSAYVWKFDPGSSQVSKAIVTIGNMSGANIRVLSGLQGGEQIATAGAAHLREGMKVRPLGE